MKKVVWTGGSESPLALNFIMTSAFSAVNICIDVMKQHLAAVKTAMLLA